MRPERRNAVKLLMFFDVGGSMDDHIRVVEELFSAARAEFKHMEYYYFHNCLYESVWKDNQPPPRRPRIPTWDVLHTYGSDYRVIFVGDASMSPYEIAHAGGSVEHWNEEPGALWLKRITDIYGSCVWLNPSNPKYWTYTPSIQYIQQMFEGRMYPLTMEGLDEAIKELVR
jgi:uncharacterized protein with von Willebrand factor type A (vWA) domain